ncbi:MAG: hypothetical protein JXR10_11770 [Cyclobacteriaceae bacterium]
MKVVSAIFHPLLMATYCSMLFYVTIPEIFTPIPREFIPYFIGAIFVTTALIPGLSILFMLVTSRVSNLEITDIRERFFPFFSIGLFYGASTYMFYTKMILPQPLLVIMLGVTVMIFLILLISLRFKISVHSAGIWGVAGFYSALSIKYLASGTLLPLLVIFLLAGLTTSSRLYLNRHTTTESWSGAIFGFLFCFMCFAFFG